MEGLCYWSSCANLTTVMRVDLQIRDFLHNHCRRSITPSRITSVGAKLRLLVAPANTVAALGSLQTQLSRCSVFLASVFGTSLVYLNIHLLIFPPFLTLTNFFSIYHGTYLRYRQRHSHCITVTTAHQLSPRLTSWCGESKTCQKS